MKTQRYRIQFSKTEAMRFTGHLDLILTWERTFRRAGIPLSYSEGFNPRPVINLASPLPLGFLSTAEVGDFWISENATRNDFLEKLGRALPPGLLINKVEEIPDLHGVKLPSLVDRSEYTVTLPAVGPQLAEQIQDLLQSERLIRSRKGKEYDLRPLIHKIDPPHIGETPVSILISLYTKPSGTGRPDEVLLALDLSPSESVICRTAIILRTGDDT